MNWQISLQAFGWGALSAISLPIGALLGIWLRPNKKVTSALMAFGGGALLFALTLELFGEAVHELEVHGRASVLVMVAGAILGGLLFDFLNQLLNNQGGFLRKMSTTNKYVAKAKWLTAKKVVKELGKISILHDLPPSEVAKLVPHMVKKHYSKGEMIFQQGEKGQALYFIVKGQVKITKSTSGGNVEIATLAANDVFGEMALLTDMPRSATAIAIDDMEVWMLLRIDFEAILRSSKSLQEKMGHLLKQRIEDLEKRSEQEVRINGSWQLAAQKHLDQLPMLVTNEDVQHEINKVKPAAGGAAFAIWLGLLIDGVPESLVIGMLANSASGMSLAFIVGVFLANLPESLSSSVGMKNQGMKLSKILIMWFSITLMTGIGAFLGAALFPADLHGGMLYVVMGIEGLAAGAMLTMIAETMLPEAFEQGGAVVGMATLMGFICALLVKIM
jgi:CRP-like cAMP-binding protein